MMYPPKLKKIIHHFKHATKRFPAALIAAATITVSGLTLLHNEELVELTSLIITAVLGFLLFVSAVLVSETRKWDKKQELGAHALIAAALILFYIWLPDIFFEARKFYIILTALWIIAAVLFISIAPFCTKSWKEQIPAFWEYNKTLVFSVLLTGIWTGVFYAGLAIALQVIGVLFQIDIPGERYAELSIVLNGIFATTFLLSRIPKKITEKKEASPYPKELRLFAQYVLLSLTTVYFLILYAYSIRILGRWEWPEGDLVYMIIGFSSLGILTYLALFPLRPTVAWIKKTGNVFFLVLIPQTVMLFIALGFRVSEYGITENRYFVFIGGLWLLGMAIYFLGSKRKDIRVIPVSLIIIAICSSFGPWGARAISKNNQLHRLETILVQNEMLTDGSITESTKELSFEDEKEISGIVRYLNEFHGYKALQKWTDVDIQQLELELSTDHSNNSYERRKLTEKIIDDVFGITYLEKYQYKPRDAPRQDYFSHYTTYEDRGAYYEIGGYDYQIDLNSRDRYTANINGDTYEFHTEDKINFTVLKNELVIAQLSLIDLVDSLGGASDKRDLNRDQLHLEIDNQVIKLELYIDELAEHRNAEGAHTIDRISGKLFFRLK
jgi:MFS family permease